MRRKKKKLEREKIQKENELKKQEELRKEQILKERQLEYRQQLTNISQSNSQSTPEPSLHVEDRLNDNNNNNDNSKKKNNLNENNINNAMRRVGSLNVDEEIDSDVESDYYTESESDKQSNSHKSENSLDSIDDTLLDKVDEKNNNKEGKKDENEEKKEDPALIVIVVERAGSDAVNGKYMFRGMQRDLPLWENESNKKAKLWYKYDNLWTLEYDNEDLYIAYTSRTLPPSSGWEAVDNGVYPAPGVILNRIQQQTIAKEDTTPDAYSPIDFIVHKFVIGTPLGFTLKKENNLLCVDAITQGQATEIDLQQNDIISHIENEDISLIGDVNKLWRYMHEIINKKKSKQ